jgi:hypothetical protein
MQIHTTPHLENTIEEAFSGDQVVGRQEPAHHAPGVSLKYSWGLCSMSRLIGMTLIARRPVFIMSDVACRPVNPRLWSGFLVWLL